MRLLVGTRNAHKLGEIRRILGEMPVEVVDLSGFKGVGEAVEEGETFQENAGAKALFFARETGLYTIADDSGLEVDALGGRPGVYSARYAGEGATDEANNAKLMREMEGVAEGGRGARFRCVIALAGVAGVEFVTEGHVEGEIARERRGESGFGYDPLFYVAGLGATFAEVGGEAKDTVSHRGRALAAFKERFGEWLGGR